MYSLVIDTTTKKQFLGIFKDACLVASIEKLSENSHMEIIFDNLNNLKQKANLDFSQLDEIIVVNGPGSFTGVRIGIIVAKTLACEYKIDLYTISTLKLLATSYLDKNEIVISMSKLKNFVINYDIIKGKLVNISQTSRINNGEQLTNIELNYNNLFEHRYLLEKTSYLDAQPNYIETPNFVKKLNK